MVPALRSRRVRRHPPARLGPDGLAVARQGIAASSALRLDRPPRHALWIPDRDQDPERGAAAVTLLDPHPSTVELGGSRREREPDPNAGVVRGRHRPVFERTEDGLPMFLGNAWPSSSTAIST